MTNAVDAFVAWSQDRYELAAPKALG